MEEDDEIQSPQQSPDSGSPLSSSPPRPPSNGRITVTVASAPPPPPSSSAPPPHHNNNTLTLALPIQQPRTTNASSGGGGGGGREDCWSEAATSVLIDAWGERYLQLSRGNLKQKHWKEVADIVSSRDDYRKTPKTDIQCKNRIDTVKKKYKLEKTRIASGGGPSKWPFFERLDHLIGPTAKIPFSSTTPLAMKVPLGIPVGLRSSSAAAAANQYNNSQNFNKQQQNNSSNKQKKLELVLRSSGGGTGSGSGSGSGQRFPMFKKRGGVETDSESELEPDERDSMDSLPPVTTRERKRPRTMVMGREERGGRGGHSDRRGGGGGGGGGGGWGNAVRELTQAILRFGEAYEQAESAKLQQVVEMEKQRMKFAKELELQRMQFFMKTQLEISQLKHGGGRRGSGGAAAGNASNHHSNNNINNSDSSN